jgi:hypothetical protein
MNTEMTLTDTVNSKFHSIAAGFPEAESTPAMTTPTVIVACEMLVTGSTICLVC